MKSVYSCRVCGESIERVSSFLGFRWGSCSHCSCTQKLLSEAEYLGLNPTYDPGMYIANVETREQLRTSLNVDEKVRFLQEYCGKNPSGKSLLDIGCGLGGFLLAAKEVGMVACGFEPSERHCSLLSSIHPGEFEVTNDYFSSEKCNRQYDFIMMSHVIEHIYRPGEFLADVSQCLAPGGMLFVVTPNNESVAALTTRSRWVMYKPVDHVSMIGPKAAKIIKPDGCQIVSISSNEYRGEFTVHMLSALKSIYSGFRPTGRLAAGDQPRLQVSAGSFSEFTKILLQCFAFPFWVFGRSTNRLACMTAVYIKNADHNGVPTANPSS